MFDKFIKGIGDFLNGTQDNRRKNEEFEEDKVETSNPNKPNRSPIKGNSGHRGIHRTNTNIINDRKFSTMIIFSIVFH